jgi:hypothetical protein
VSPVSVGLDVNTVCTVGDRVSPREGALDGDLLVGFVVVGCTVGDHDSLGLVGPIVGLFVELLGAFDGLLVVKEGDFVGFSVGGLFVGAFVGDVVVLVGLSLGASVSPKLDGPLLGVYVLLEGAIVGVLLSDVVGDFEGARVLSVGEIVGCSVSLLLVGPIVGVAVMLLGD